MAQTLEAVQAEWKARESNSLAGQIATIVNRNGSRKQVRFGPDVKLRRESRGQVAGASLLHPVVEGHIESAERKLDPEDQDLVLSDGSVFRISYTHDSFFFAVAAYAC